MSKVLVTESHLNNIAEAIRAKNGAPTTYRPGDMAAAIQALDTSGIHPTGTKQITTNGTHDVTEYASANVLVTPNLQSKTVTENGTVTPDQGYDGLSEVIVNVSGGSPVVSDLVLMDASIPIVSGSVVALAAYARQTQFNDFQYSTQDGRKCWYRGGYGVTTNIILKKISAGSYRKLYVKTRVWVYGSGWQQAKVFLARSIAMSNNQPSTAFKTIVLASQDYTSAQINAQTGVVINSTSNNVLEYQLVEIDISDVNEDFYVGFWNCDLYMYITDIYLEA